MSVRKLWCREILVCYGMLDPYRLSCLKERFTEKYMIAHVLHTNISMHMWSKER